MYKIKRQKDLRSLHRDKYVDSNSNLPSKFLHFGKFEYVLSKSGWIFIQAFPCLAIQTSIDNIFHSVEILLGQFYLKWNVMLPLFESLYVFQIVFASLQFMRRLVCLVLRMVVCRSNFIQRQFNQLCPSTIRSSVHSNRPQKNDPNIH